MNALNRFDKERIVELIIKNEIKDISGMDLSGCAIRCIDMSGMKCRGTNFKGAILSGSKLAGADLKGAVFTNADLSGCDLTGANMLFCDVEYASFNNAILNRTNFAFVPLHNTDLSSAEQTNIKRYNLAFILSMKAIAITFSVFLYLMYDYLTILL